jgi:2-polyprenyl-6-methoxyphenol hydroxylase-like FAD-dependent oxidoreductase
MVMLTSMLDEDIPTDDVAMLEFGEGLPAREIAEVLRSAVPSNDAAKMRFPGSRLRHFENVGRHLEGFLVVGDALCSLNPVYGQGMTVAVMEAELLANLFENGGENDGRGDISARFQASAAALLAEPWAVSTGGDLRFDGVEVQGPWTPQSYEGSRYLDRLTAAAAVDPVLGSALLHVTNLVTPTASLFAPELEERVRAVTTQVRK